VPGPGGREKRLFGGGGVSSKRGSTGAGAHSEVRLLRSVDKGMSRVSSIWEREKSCEKYDATRVNVLDP